MKSAALVFPNQLFASGPSLRPGSPIYLVEDLRFFSDFTFHKQKLVLHRASMKAYQDFLANKGFEVRYLEYAHLAPSHSLFDILSKENFGEITTLDPVDAPLEARLREGAARAGFQLTFLENPGFICKPSEIREYFQDAKRFYQTKFYQHQRRRLDILMEGDKPVGGRWTYDTANRRKLPKGTKVPPLTTLAENPYVIEARQYVTVNFPDNPGSLETFIYPVTHEAARRWLHDFVERRLVNFGEFQDAISASEPYIFHSLLSPLINIGLLTPLEVLDAALAYAREQPVPLNSLEGFVRQVLGWREYVRAVYVLAGEKQRTANFWGHTRNLPEAFYTGDTGIEPVDTVIRRVLHTGYAHHIERLMVLGNFMLLCEIDPDEIYRWFMELFIDAYDWVMVPNVYGMSQFADGGLIMTKPYLSGSNYLRLYWRFIEKHRDYFAKNPRLAPMLKNLHRMAPERRTSIYHAAEALLAKLH
jgi:deoxyribodipyrimidine photolyase-related protein